VARQVVGAADMAGNDGDNELSGTVDTDNGGVVILILQRRRYASDTNPESANENDSLKLLPMFFQEWCIRPDGRTSGDFILRVNTKNALLLWYFVSLAEKMLARQNTTRSDAFRRVDRPTSALRFALMFRLARREMLARQNITRSTPRYPLSDGQRRF
jgi:hypothetical protein